MIWWTHRRNGHPRIATPRPTERIETCGGGLCGVNKGVVRGLCGGCAGISAPRAHLGRILGGRPGRRGPMAYHCFCKELAAT